MKFLYKAIYIALIGIFLTGGSFVECFWSKFLRGRRFNNLKGLKASSNIPEQYYDQRLDHFNEALKTTWKQVN